jgi:hypothetical protein
MDRQITGRCVLFERGPSSMPTALHRRWAPSYQERHAQQSAEVGAAALDAAAGRGPGERCRPHYLIQSSSAVHAGRLLITQTLQRAVMMMTPGRTEPKRRALCLGLFLLASAPGCRTLEGSVRISGGPLGDRVLQAEECSSGRHRGFFGVDVYMTAASAEQSAPEPQAHYVRINGRARFLEDATLGPARANAVDEPLGCSPGWNPCQCPFDNTCCPPATFCDCTSGWPSCE